MFNTQALSGNKTFLTRFTQWFTVLQGVIPNRFRRTLHKERFTRIAQDVPSTGTAPLKVSELAKITRVSTRCRGSGACSAGF